MRILLDPSQPLGTLYSDFCFIGAYRANDTVITAIVNIKHASELPYNELRELMKNTHAGYFNIIVEWTDSEGNSCVETFRGDDDDESDKFINSTVSKIDSTTV